MIRTAALSNSTPHTSYAVHDATAPLPPPSPPYTKIFSNAALHWILRDPSTRTSVFTTLASALAPHGTLVLEMGGQGNVAEMRAALLSAVGRRVGPQRARDADPWFFPDEEWMGEALKEVGFVVEKSELEYRPTRCEEGEGGGVRGWVDVMGKRFFEAVEDEGERAECREEVVSVLESVCASPCGGSFIGYVRLRIKARKV